MSDTSYRSVPTGFVWIPLAGWVPVRTLLDTNNVAPPSTDHQK